MVLDKRDQFCTAEKHYLEEDAFLWSHDKNGRYGKKCIIEGKVEETEEEEVH